MLTIFELLDRLETEIVSLRSQNLELRTSLHVGDANGTARGAAEHKRSSKKKSLKRPVAKSKKKAAGKKTVKQLELPVAADGAADEEPKRSLGKRQALGKSLLQLRKGSASH